jgi:hypothetical protein
MSNAWDCPEGLVVDGISRFSGCNVGIGFAQALGWYYLVVLPPLAPLFLYTAAKIHRHAPNSSPSRLHGMAYFGLSVTLLSPFCSYPAFNPRKPVTSDLALSLSGGVGGLVMLIGGFRLLIGHYVASAFQLVSGFQHA